LYHNNIICTNVHNKQKRWGGHRHRLYCVLAQFLAIHTNSRAYATVLRMSDVCNIMYCG